jgi:hypothetical protein
MIAHHRQFLHSPRHDWRACFIHRSTLILVTFDEALR